jgi:hypothetical protein
MPGLRHGAQGRNRTTDTVIFSHVLYQLSYLGARNSPSGPVRRRLYRGSSRTCLAQEPLRAASTSGRQAQLHAPVQLQGVLARELPAFRAQERLAPAFRHQHELADIPRFAQIAGDAVEPTP